VDTTLTNCINFEKFSIFDIQKCPNFVQFLKENYLKHCTRCEDENLSEILSTKMTFCADLSNLSQFDNPSRIEYLSIEIYDPELPCEDEWENYKNQFAFCPRLKCICLHIVDENYEAINLGEILENLSPENQDIWKERILYFQSCGIAVISKQEYETKFKELCKQIKWRFEFWGSQEN